VFEVLEHTADIGLRAEGATICEMFEAAAEALMSIAIETGDVQPRSPYPITATGENLGELLVNYLNEVLYWLDGRQVACGRFEVHRLTQEHVDATAWGEPRDAQRHPARVVVKGVTYHQLTITQTRGRWVAEVYLDI
jgi:SHS2 domain-containing protein